MTRARSLLFNLLFYGLTAVACFALLWALLLPKRGFLAVIRGYLRLVTFLEWHVLGLRYRVLGRDTLPDGPVLIAAKHQSAWETMKLHLLLDDPAVVLKRELLNLPIWGWYARKADLIPVDRGARGRAVASVVRGGRRVAAQGRPIAIFPQGTRTAPGDWRPYKIGIVALYEALNLPVVPVALNSGLFWGRNALWKRSGTITVEFLPPIPPGLPREVFLRRLITELESASDRLSLAAGGPATDWRAHLPEADDQDTGNGTAETEQDANKA